MPDGHRNEVASDAKTDAIGGPDSDGFEGRQVGVGVLNIPRAGTGIEARAATDPCNILEKRFE